MERLQKFRDHSLGLHREKLFLQSHVPRWKRIYSDEAYFIFDSLKNESLRLYHCGSTAVAGLDAKPIIDILGSVRSLEELDAQKEKLERIGYEAKGESGIPGRRYFVFYDPEKTTTFVHLHIFEHGNPEIERHLSFRDQLKRSDQARSAYLSHKKSLIDELKVARDQYAPGKDAIIQKIQKEADVHAKKPKKVFAVTQYAAKDSGTEKFLREVYPAHLEVMDLETYPVGPYHPSAPKDSFYAIIEKALQADLFVLTTPVYWYAMSGPMKDFIDRFSNLMVGDYKHLGEALQGKRVQLLSTGYDRTLPIGFEVPFAGISIYFGMDYMGALYKSMRG